MDKEWRPGPGAAIEIAYPFVIQDRETDERDKFVADPNMKWRPGTRQVQVYDYFETVADGVGMMILTVVSVHKPGKYPERVFFTREWIDPDGKRFSPLKNKLHIQTRGIFQQLCRGYRHRFELSAEAQKLPAPTKELAAP